MQCLTLWNTTCKITQSILYRLRHRYVRYNHINKANIMVVKMLVGGGIFTAKITLLISTSTSIQSLYTSLFLQKINIVMFALFVRF